MSQILFVMSRSPGTINAQEGFDALLMGSAFAQCSVLFLGDGLYQLLKEQNPEPIGSKNYTKGFSALSDYGVTQIYCSESQLEETGIKSGELNINVELLTDDEINQLFVEHQSVLSF